MGNPNELFGRPHTTITLRVIFLWVHIPKFLTGVHRDFPYILVKKIHDSESLSFLLERPRNELSCWLVMFVLSFFFLPGKLLPRKPLIFSVAVSCWAQTNSWPDSLLHILDISSNRDLKGLLVFITPKSDTQMSQGLLYARKVGIFLVPEIELINIHCLEWWWSGTLIPECSYGRVEEKIEILPGFQTQRFSPKFEKYFPAGIKSQAIET